MTAPDPASLPYRPCVGVMLLDGEGRAFAGQRIDSDIEAWQMPQGGVDEGEGAREAALRELREETGIAEELVRIEAEAPETFRYDLPADLVPALWGGRFRGQEQRWFLMRFLGTDADVDIETEHAEFSRWAWMKPNDILDLIVPFKRQVYQGVFAAFRDHL